MNVPATRQEIMAQADRRPIAASQATSIEQSRAVAEVQAAFTVAAARPRDPVRALADVMESCRMKSVAEGAFFKFPRGGKSVTGETIHLATEMARCWGNISYSVSELERNDQRGISEMLAVATDLQTNTSSRTSFIVPHRRDKEGGAPASPLTSMRDIYENNANMGARRLRECIFRVLPTWLVDEARSACYDTLAHDGDERPLPVRIADAIERFAEIGVGKERIEAKAGPTSSLTAVDLAALQISFRSIKRGEIGAEEEFPKVGHVETAKEIAGRTERRPAETATRDNPNAAEGRSDEQHGDQHDDSDIDPRRKLADEIIAAAGKVNNAQELGDLRGLRAADIAAMPDDIGLEIIRALEAAAERVKPGNLV